MPPTEPDKTDANNDRTVNYQPGDTNPRPPVGATEPLLTSDLSNSEIAGLVRADQRRRWKQGERVRAEAYLSDFPTLNKDPQGILDLVYNEVLLREERGEHPDIEEYVGRFPQLAAQLRRQFALHKALASGMSLPSASDSSDDTIAPVRAAAVPADTARPTVVGYDIVSELGRGGMGVVYKAQQTTLKRTVALKMILAGAHASKTDLARFRTEAEAVASLQHENIVQIYEVGEQEGRPYFSLEFVGGGSLDDKLDKDGPLPPLVAAKLLEALARAVQAAHQRGIIHRDLKPANVLLTSDGVPKITDFGLAKRLDGGKGQTESGSVMGTPSYMAPEQASGNTRELGTPADIWSLGAILYDTLTGRPPFLADSPIDTMLQVVHEEPLPPSRLQPKVPRDLETICMKCLQKSPAKRYATAKDLADDLRRFLNNEPIVARPVGLWERGIKWARRRPAMAGMLAVSALALLALLGAGVWYEVHLEKALTDAKTQHHRAEEAGRELDSQLLRLKVFTGNQLVNDGDLMGSLPWFVQALEKEEKDPARAELSRIRIGTVLRESPWLEQMFFHKGRVTWAAYSPRARRVLTASADRTARVWDASTGQPIGEPMRHEDVIERAAFSPDGTLVATASLDHTARVWDAKTGKPVTEPLKHDDAVTRVQFSRDGKKVLTASKDATARIWDIATGKEVRRFSHSGPVNAAVFNHDSSRVATAGDDNIALVWNAQTGEIVTPELRHDGPVLDVAFNPAGDKVATGSADATAKVWDATTGKQLNRRELQHYGPVIFVAFSPDAAGRQLVSTSEDNRVRLWDVTDGYVLVATLKHGSNVYSASFSPDGKRIATASDDNTARVWDTVTGEPLGVPLKHPATVYRAVFTPDGKNVLTAGADGSARVWDPEANSVMGAVMRGHKAPLTSALFNPDGNQVATSSDDRTAAVWDAKSGKRLGVMHHEGVVHRVRYNKDGTKLLTCSADNTARIWDATTHRQLQKLGHNGDVVSAAFSPDGARVVTASADKTARVWDAATGRMITEYTGHKGPVTWAAFSPDGKRVVTASADDTAQVWDAATGQRLLPDLRHTDDVNRAVFSPDGRRIVTASEDGTAQVWDATTGARVGRPMRHNSKVYKAVFSPRGKRVATASDDNTARIWDAETGEPLTPPLRHGGTVSRVQFSPDGRRVATASEDNTARVWDAQTGEPLTPPLPHQVSVVDVYFGPKGDRVVTASKDRTARVWHLEPDLHPIEELVQVAKLLAGGWIDETGGFVPLRPRELEEVWRKVRADRPAKQSSKNQHPER